MLAEKDIPALFCAFRERYNDRDGRMTLLDSVVAGDWNVLDPDSEKLTSRSPNLVQVALEDTAEAAGLMPTVRVSPRRPTQRLKDMAARMERIAAGYWDFSQMELLVPQTIMDMAGFGFASWVVWPDFDERLPVIEKRDPRTCYPEPGFRPGQAARRVIFARNVHYSQLPPLYQRLCRDFVIGASGEYLEEKSHVTLVEFFDEEEYVIAALFNPGISATPGVSDYVPVLLDRIPNRTGVCPVVVGSRFALDGEFRGQFDQIIGVLEAHVRLMAMVLDYADQAVYSDIWVKDLIGEMPFGGGAYIELGPQGAIGRVPPAVTSLNIQQDLDRLVDSIHVGGRWPKSRPGEIDQSIASAKFIEASAGMMNTAIKTYHQILQRMMEHALRLCFLTDQKYFPGPKSVSGILRNQEFVEEYDATKDVDIKNRIRIEYGLGLGRDPAQSAVLMIQYAKESYISNEFVQENIDGLTDVGRERVRIDTETFESMMKADLLQRLQAQQLPAKALADIIDARERGESLSAIYRKYVVTEDQAPTQPAGLPGVPGAPGAPPAPGPGPGAPPGGLPSPPPAPDAGSLVARLGVPAGNRNSFLSVQQG